MFQKSSKYKKVSQNDSEDDEVLLYAATPLNQNGEDIDDDQTFGTREYNRDLRLNLSPPDYFQAKAKLKDRRHMIYSGLLCAAVIVVLLGVAGTVIVYAQVYVPQNPNNVITSTDTPTTANIDPNCVTPPPPLSGKIKGCKSKKPPIDSTTKVPLNVLRPSTEPVTQEKTTNIAIPTVTPSKMPNAKTTGTSPTTYASKGPGEKTTSLPGLTTKIAGDESSSPQGTVINPTSSATTELNHEKTTDVSQEKNIMYTSSEITEMNEPTYPITTENDLSLSTSTTESSQFIHSQPEPFSHSVDWTKDMFPAVTELSLQFFDMNKDGIQDLLTAKVTDKCTCSLLALDGHSGEIVWQTQVNFDVFSLRCILDSNQDDVIDCIATGRSGGFISINGVDGMIIWTVDKDITFPKYNFYFPLLVADLDEDGVPDLINTHGGDADYPPWEMNRSPGFFVVVSGRTGGELMEPILIPDGRETYCSPVLFTMNNIDLVLFGSGGETLSGSLWGVTLASIRNKVSKNMAEITQYEMIADDLFHPCFMDVESLRPTFNKTLFDNKYQLPECPGSMTHTLVPNLYNLCLYEIHRSESKGIVLPPLILDLNNDGTQDLLVSTFDGHLYAYDGANMATLLWEVFNPKTESYSLPTPLFYNQDYTPDLFIRANTGEWASTYNSSVLILIDGQSGETLWSFDSIYPAMHSGLSLIADTHGQDALLFFAIGEKRNRMRRHGNMQEGPHYHDKPVFEPDDLWTSTPEDYFPDPDEELDSFLNYCGHTMHELSVHVYLLTREMIEEGEVKPIMTEGPFVFRGNLPANFSVDVKRQASDQFNPSSSTDQVDENMIGEANTNFQESKEGNVLPSFDPIDLPPNLPPGYIPPSFDPNDLPPGFTPPSFDPNDLPPDLPPGYIPPGFDPNDSSPDFSPGIQPPPVNKKKARCAHILLPTSDPATSTIGDVNDDGKLELSYVIRWEGISSSDDYFVPQPPKIRIRTFTLEDRFEVVYGRGKLDFSQLLPLDKQPWTKYMGKTGDNMFRTNKGKT